MRKVIAIFLLINILTSSVSLTFASHYCGGHIAKFKLTLGETDLNCGMVERETACQLNNTDPMAHWQNKSCCENSYEFSESDNTILNKTSVKTFSPELIVTLSHIYLSLSPLENTIKRTFIGYSPPLIEHDIPIFVQSFLL